jgi:trans-aconitate 2-methyltransferase
VPHDWDAATYDRLPIPMTGWGLQVLERLELRGDETVLDAGCGTGLVTAALRDRLPNGHVIALDASPSMIAAAVERLGADRVTYLTHDLMDPIPIEPVDAVFSTATFHWIPDHDRLFENLAAVLLPGGQLIAQCGGWGNLERVNTAAMRALGIDIAATKTYASPEETWTRLEAEGFVDIETWLQEAPVELPAGELEPYLRTVILSGEVARRSPEEADALVHAVATELREPLIDYVRLNIVARRPGAN